MNNNLPPQNQEPLIPNEQVSRPVLAPKIFTEEECLTIIALSDKLPLIEGSVGVGDTSKIESSVRESSIKWLTPDEEFSWIFQRIYGAVNEANKHFRFNLRGFKAIQIARYNVGGHFNTWHSDMGLGESSLRKLSISVQLSGPEDYDGGKLEFQVLQDELQHSKECGTTIIFPPYMTHRVTPVTRGTRWSLVAWIMGPPFC